jgi:hypothetical protein
MTCFAAQSVISEQLKLKTIEQWKSSLSEVLAAED